MSVKITLGNKLQKTEIAQEELNSRLMELTENLSNKNLENKKLTDQNNYLNTKIFNLDQKISEISLQNSELNKKLEKTNNSNKQTETEYQNLQEKNVDLTNTNNTLKHEIEKLLDDLNNQKLKSGNYLKEIKEVYKTKDKFELQVIELTELNEKLNENLRIIENVLRQKEKYIEILINKNKSCEFVKEFNEKNKITKNKSDNIKDASRNNIPATHVTNIIVLQNKILELEEKLSQRDDQIKKLEIEKSNLFTRLRNLSHK